MYHQGIKRTVWLVWLIMKPMCKTKLLSSCGIANDRSLPPNHSETVSDIKLYYSSLGSGRHWSETKNCSYIRKDLADLAKENNYLRPLPFNWSRAVVCQICTRKISYFLREMSRFLGHTDYAIFTQSGTWVIVCLLTPSSSRSTINVFGLLLKQRE